MKALPYNKTGISIFCPGCQTIHSCERHTHDSNWESPTISPSLLVTWGDGTRCHSFVRNGEIEFLDDSTFHTLRGKHLLSDIPGRFIKP